jgi:hypothetical protein
LVVLYGKQRKSVRRLVQELVEAPISGHLPDVVQRRVEAGARTTETTTRRGQVAFQKQGVEQFPLALRQVLAQPDQACPKVSEVRGGFGISLRSKVG